MRRLRSRRLRAAAATLALALSAVAGAELAQAAPVGPDLSARGPHQVTRTGYDFGDTAFEVEGFPGGIELAGVVHHPGVLDRGYPLVLIQHGRHSTCGLPDGKATMEWPCLAGTTPIRSLAGYEYLADNLASHGYVVVSIGANGINAVDQKTADRGMAARAALIEKHLRLWVDWATRGGAPFGDRFRGAVDLTRVGTMGHSRGGEGVVTHQVSYGAKAVDYRLGAVFALAPVDFYRPKINGTPFATLLPTCDGDVSDLQGARFYDDSRYAVAGDPAAKYTVAVTAANHNFFNTVWSPSSGVAGALDDAGYLPDWEGEESICHPRNARRLSETEQRAVGLGYVNGFFRAQLGGESALAPVWSGRVEQPAGIPTKAAVQVAYHAPDLAERRRDVNRLVSEADLERNQLGGSVTVAKLDSALRTAPRAPHLGLRLLRTVWDQRGGALVNTLPAGSRDVSRYATLRLRAVQDSRDRRNTPGVEQDLSVVLVDGAGRTAAVPVAPRSRALDYPEVGRDLFLLGQVRVELAEFTGVDLTDVREVRLVFDRFERGGIGVDDLLFSD